MSVRLLKEFKFAPSLHVLLRAGEKYATWRLFYDGPELMVGDGLILCGSQGADEQLGHARVTEVITKPFGELTAADREGHEAYSSDREMYETFAGYYGQPVDETTIVLVVKFEVLGLFVTTPRSVVIVLPDN